MVGVPGRSKGCATCRRRKKGCDLQQPKCGQCMASGLHCGGYDRQRIFINHTLDTNCKALVPVRPQIILHDALTRSAYESKTLGLFWESYLPQGKPFNAIDAQYTTGSWLSVVESIYHRDDTLKHALLALGLGTVGRKQGDTWMKSQGIASHGHALKGMAKAVQSPEGAQKDELLAAARLLSIFEILFGADAQDKASQARGWSSHVYGELVLMQARGPHMHMSGPAHQIFADGRLSTIIAGIRARKTIALSAPAWKEIPWLTTPKTPKDALLDIMVDLPTLLETSDTATSPTTRAALVADCWALDARLTTWLQLLAPTAPLATLPRVHELHSFALAQLTLVYWAACIILYTVLHSATTDLLPPRTDPRVYARKIAHSADYFFGPEAGVFGTHAASFPIGLAFTVLAGDEDEEERRLLLGTMRRGDRGATIARFLNSMRQRYSVMYRFHEEEE